MKIRVMVVREGKPSKAELNNPLAVFNFMKRRARGLDREHFWRIDVDSRSKPISVDTVSVGTLSASLVHPREFFRPALVLPTAGVIAIHNHPSGETTPSPEDKDATNRLRRAGELLGVPLLDHVIVSDTSFFSFKEAGLL